MGRSRDVGDERWATVTEAAEALGVTAQAIYNRIKAKTIPYDEQVDPTTERASYRIDRAWLLAEVERKAASTPATTGHLAHEGETRAAEIIATFIEYAERIIEANEATRREVETQHTELLPLQRRQLENQTKMLGGLEGMRNDLQEFFKLARRLDARLNERERVEREYQQANLELQEKVYGLLSRVEESERERAEQGQAERRSFWRRLFSGD